MLTISKREAMLVFHNWTLEYPIRIMKFDDGKYKWHGSCKPFIGREVVDCKGVLAVFPERRQDSNGPYTQLMCVTAI